MILTAVADKRGRVLAVTDPRRVPVDSAIGDLARGAAALEKTSVDGAPPILRLLAPLVYQGRTVGQIAIELDVSDLLGERRLEERERFVGLGRLSSSPAHEIINPLVGRLNATDKIRSFPDRPHVVRKSADLLDRGLRHLRDVTRVTLDQNRLDPEDRALSLVDFEDLRLAIRPEVSHKALALDWTVDLSGDALHDLAAGPVRQIVLNLLLNACAAAGHGGGVVLIARQQAGGIILQIGDTGPGLSQVAQDRLLTDAPFAPGGGAGLRMARELARGLGGGLAHLRADDQTLIIVRLPNLADARDA